MATLLTVLQGATALAAYVVNILSSTTLGAEGRGFLVLILQLTYFASVFVVLGIERPFMARIQLTFAPALRLFIHLARPGAMIAPLGLCGGVALVLMDRATLGIALLLGTVYALLIGIGKGVRAASISSGTSGPLVAFTLGTQGGMVLLGVLLSVFAVDSPLLWLAAYTLTGFTSLAIFAHAAHKRESGRVDNHTSRIIRSQGLRLLPASIGNTAMVRSDRLILPAFLGIGPLGVYSAVSTVMEMASWPIAQWVDASLGRWRVTGQNLRGRDLARLSIGAVMVATLIAGVIGAIAYLSIVLFLPDEFAASIPLIAPLGVSSIIYALGRVQQGVLIIRGLAGSVSVVELLGTSGAIVAYLVLIPVFGMAGAAYGSIIGYSVTAVTGALALYMPRRQK